LTGSLHLHNSLLSHPELLNLDDDSGFLDLQDSNVAQLITSSDSIGPNRGWILGLLSPGSEKGDGFLGHGGKDYAEEL
jgi:hypothetical protein